MNFIKENFVLKDKEIILIDRDSICNFINQIVVETVAEIQNWTFETTVFDNKLSAISYLFDTEKLAKTRYVFLDLRTLDDDWFEILDLYEKKSPIADKIFVLTASLEYKLKEKCLSYRSVSYYIEKPLTTEIFKHII